MTQRCKQCKSEVSKDAFICPCCENKTGSRSKPKTGHNKYGISRFIPESVRKRVREECGFGCVFDGTMIVNYDHFSPEFADLKSPHSADGIALLCPNCHSRRLGDNPQIQASMVAVQRLKPFAKHKGNPKYPDFFMPPSPDVLELGSIILRSPQIRLSVNDKTVLQLKASSDEFGPIFVDAYLKNQSGATLLRIVDNELTVAPAIGFDFTSKAAWICFSLGGTTFLELDRSEPGKVKILKADFWFDNHHLEINKEGLYVDGKAKIAGGELEIVAGACINIIV